MTLKREPNAAGQPRHLVRRGLKPDGTYPLADDDEPALAAPDVAEMVKQLYSTARALRILSANEQEAEGKDSAMAAMFFEMSQEIDQAAALLARLGQRWIPQGIPIGQCCCRAHHPNYGRCLQCPIHGMLPPGASDE